MSLLFQYELLNQPFGDPALYVRLMGEKKALLFDLGDLSLLPPGKIFKISHVFVTHTHIDHFIGFDHLLRLNLARDKILRIYGPHGIIRNVKGKLQGYTWNLVDTYPFIIEVFEIRTRKVVSMRFVCKSKFNAIPLSERVFNGTLDVNPHYTVRAIRLDHKIPCIAYSLEERFHININKQRLTDMGITVGKWLRELKEYIWKGSDDAIFITAPRANGETIKLPLGELRQKVTTITKGQKIVYVADCKGTPSNIKKLVAFAAQADVLFCEAAFLDKDKIKAADRGHLTAYQAGFIARESGAKNLQVFHFSPRYETCPELIYTEAEQAFFEKDS